MQKSPHNRQTSASGQLLRAVHNPLQPGDSLLLQQTLLAYLAGVVGDNPFKCPEMVEFAIPVL